MNKGHRQIVLGVVCLLSTLVAGTLYFTHFNPLTKVEFYAQDLRVLFGRKTPANPQLVYLTIDTASIKLDQLFPGEAERSAALTLMENGWPWSREVYAMLLDRLMGAGAKVVAFDLLFPTRGPGDEAFAAALARYKDSVVVAANFNSTGGAEGERSVISLPSPSVIPHSEHVDPRIGFANFVPDVDGVVRRAHYRQTIEGFGGYPATSDSRVFESVGARILRHLGRADLIPKARDGKLFRYTGPPGTFKTHPIYEVFHPALWQSNYGDGAFFKNKIVLVGPEGRWSHDEHPTPFCLSLGVDGLMSGPEIHLQALNAALSHDFLNVSSSWVDLLIIVMAGLCAWLVNVFVRMPSLRVFLMVTVSAGYGWVLQMVFEWQGLLLPTAAPLMAFNAGTFLSLLWDFVRERRERARIRATLERYVSRDIVKEILDNPATYLNTLGGVRKPVAVLFTDLRGFTDMIEQKDSVQLVSQLNEYYSEIMPHVFDHKGTVDKIMGDALMAVWGNMHTDGVAQDAESAVAAALEIKQTLTRLNADWRTRGLPELSIGIGIAHGEALVGNIGSHQKMDPTVIGDCVNLASRLESLTKQYKVDFLISDVLADLVRPAFQLQTVDLVRVKGKRNAVDVFTVIARAEDELDPETFDYLRRHEEGVQKYRQRDFAAAAVWFRECLSIRPGNRLAEIYLQRCSEGEQTGVDEEWDAVSVLTHK